MAAGQSVSPATDQGRQWRWQDSVLAAIVVGGTLFAFVKHPALQKRKWLWSIAVFILLGFVLGDLLALALFVGWTESGVPWRMTPGLVLLAASAFIIPWSTRQPVYCQFICPHGHAQRWIMKWLPARLSMRPNPDFKWSLGWVAPALIVAALATTFLRLPLDLAGLEPFDAYLLRSAATASVWVAAIGLAISLFIPMAYCHYGCPTGWLLRFVRRRSSGKPYGSTDLVGLFLLAVTFSLYRFHPQIYSWTVSAQ